MYCRCINGRTRPRPECMQHCGNHGMISISGRQSRQTDSQAGEYNDYNSTLEDNQATCGRSLDQSDSCSLRSLQAHHGDRWPLLVHRDWASHPEHSRWMESVEMTHDMRRCCRLLTEPSLLAALWMRCWRACARHPHAPNPAMLGACSLSLATHMTGWIACSRSAQSRDSPPHLLDAHLFN